MPRLDTTLWLRRLVMTTFSVLLCLPATNVWSWFSVTADPSRRTTNAIGSSPASTSGSPTTAASTTSACDNNSASNSVGATYSKVGNLVWIYTARHTATPLIFFSVLTAIFPGEPRLAGFTGAKDDGSGGDNWNYKTCKAPVKSPPPTNIHQSTESKERKG